MHDQNKKQSGLKMSILPTMKDEGYCIYVIYLVYCRSALLFDRLPHRLRLI